MKKLMTASLIAAGLFAGCGGSSHDTSATSSTTVASSAPLDTTYIAKSIQTSIRQQRSLATEVRCPPSEPRTVGETFTCTAIWHRLKAPHAQAQTSFAVTLKNVKGYVTYVGK